MVIIGAIAAWKLLSGSAPQPPTDPSIAQTLSSEPSEPTQVAPSAPAHPAHPVTAPAPENETARAESPPEPTPPAAIEEAAHDVTPEDSAFQLKINLSEEILQELEAEEAELKKWMSAEAQADGWKIHVKAPLPVLVKAGIQPEDLITYLSLEKAGGDSSQAQLARRLGELLERLQ